MNNLTIEGNGQQIVVGVNGYENPKANNISDANWLISKVQINITGLKYQSSLELTTYDIYSFYSQILEAAENLNSESVLDNDSGSFRLKIVVCKNGVVNIEVSTQNILGFLRSDLNVSFKIDQTYLSRIIGDLREIIESYPVIT